MQRPPLSSCMLSTKALVEKSKRILRTYQLGILSGPKLFKRIKIYFFFYVLLILAVLVVYINK